MRAYAITMPDGRVAITRLTPRKIHSRDDFENDADFAAAEAAEDIRQSFQLAKTLFELSRTEPLEHFDGSVHTLAAIEAGLPGHFRLVSVEVDDQSDMPDYSDNRDSWEIFEGKVRVKPV